MTTENDIINIWKAEGFVGQNKLQKILSDKNIKFKSKDLSKLIKEQKTYQIHKEYKKNQKALGHIISFAKDAKWQIDLIDMTPYGNNNNGYKWILIAIDIFTRKGYAEPIKNKSQNNITEAFNKLITNEKPSIVMSDKGSEFINKEFKDNLNNKEIGQQLAEVGDHHALGIIDRFIRTIKSMIFKSITDNQNTKWIDKLNTYVNAYNNHPHRGIDEIKPNEAETDKNKEKILNLNINKAQDTNEIQNDIQIGDKVRVKIMKTFQKGYEPQYTEDVYTVIKVNKISAILDDNKKYKLSQLQKVNNIIENTPNIKETNVINIAKKDKKSKITFKTNDINLDNIITEKRKRKAKVIFTL